MYISLFNVMFDSISFQRRITLCRKHFLCFILIRIETHIKCDSSRSDHLHDASLRHIGILITCSWLRLEYRLVASQWWKHLLFRSAPTAIQAHPALSFSIVACRWHVTPLKWAIWRMNSYRIALSQWARRSITILEVFCLLNESFEICIFSHIIAASWIESDGHPSAQLSDRDDKQEKTHLNYKRPLLHAYFQG